MSPELAYFLGFVAGFLGFSAREYMRRPQYKLRCPYCSGVMICRIHPKAVMDNNVKE